MPLPSPATAECEFEPDASLRGAGTPAEQVRSGDREGAFAAIVGRHARLMFRVAFSLLRNAQDAEDAVQEAFLKLYRGEAWLRMEDEKAFLARTVWRVALDRMPAKEERPFAEDEQFAAPGPSPETAAVRESQAALLRRMIDALPEELRQVLVLSAIEELNSREIAALLGIPEGTVRTRMMRAREALKRQFEATREVGA